MTASIEDMDLSRAVARTICEAWAAHKGSEDFDWDLLVAAHAKGSDAFPKLHEMMETALSEADAVIAKFDVSFRTVPS